MLTKICTKCKVEKLLDDFYKKKSNKDGLKYWCKECCKKYMSNYIKNNKDRIKEITDARNKRYYKNNKEKVKKQASDYYYNNIESCRKRNKEYLKNHREERNNRISKWLENPRNKISVAIAGGIRRSIKNKNGEHWEKLLGYSLDTLIEHLENVSKFSIVDYLEKGLHIDHIIPVSFYDFDSYEDEGFHKCWNYRNLRIIEPTENLSKNGFIDMNLVEEYDIQDLLQLNK